MKSIESLKQKYPGAIAWQFGDSVELGNELAALVVKGVKTMGCGSLTSYINEADSPTIGGYNIILNGAGSPVCVIRTIAMKIIRFCDVDHEIAKKEGEGDLSLEYWREAHHAFFSREGSFSETMELVAEEFEIVELVA